MRRIAWALVALIIAAVVAACVAFTQWRWNTFDDQQDFIGTWRLVGTDKPVEITDTTIRLTDDVAYEYKIDPQQKTITFKFGNMTGSGRYRFSLDRQLLSITDGNYGEWDTLFDDISWTVAALWEQLVQNVQLSPGSGENTTQLTRQLDPLAGELAGGTVADSTASGADASAGAQTGTSDGAAANAGAEGANDASGDTGSGAGDATSTGSAGGNSGSANNNDMRDVDALSSAIQDI